MLSKIEVSPSVPDLLVRRVLLCCELLVSALDHSTVISQAYLPRYDLDYSGAFYPLYTFARTVADLNVQAEAVANETT